MNIIQTKKKKTDIITLSDDDDEVIILPDDSFQKKQKQLRTEIITLSDDDGDSDDDEIININRLLNDDCMIAIFKHLPYQDRLKLEFVCKRWNKLAKLSWSNVNSLILNDKMHSKYMLSYDSEKNLEFILTIISRCSIYMNNVVIENILSLNYYQIMQKIIKCCKNLTNLCIIGNINENGICFETDLQVLYNNNVKLSNVHVSGIYATGQSLNSLNSNQLQELYYEFELLDPVSVIPDFSKFKQLKKIEFKIKNHTDVLVAALSKNGCDWLTGFSTCSKQSICMNKLGEFLGKQKNLKKICIKEKEANVSFLRSLPADTLEDIKIKIDQNTLDFLDRFKNLKYFQCYINSLNDESVLKLTCLNLKKIGIIMEDDSLTSVGESYFGNFKGMESIKLNYFSIDMLKFISVSNKNLKELIIGSHILGNDKELEIICTLKELKLLKCTVSFGSNKSIKVNNVINLIDKLVKLENFVITGFSDDVIDKHDILKQINHLKFIRGDKNLLKITFNLFDATPCETRLNIDIDLQIKYSTEFPLLLLYG